MEITEQDRTQIEEAVKEAEGKTSGEIVPLVVQRSGHYDSLKPRATLMGAMLGAIISLVIVILQLPSADSYDAISLNLEFLLFAIAPILLGGFLLGLFAEKSSTLLRTLIPPEAVDETLKARAQRAFLEHELFNTRDRTGILIMVSMDEHRVTVLADAGINQKVENATWDECVELVLNGIKSGQFGQGMANAIRRCGDIVTDAGFTIKEDDTNELSDSLKVEK